MLQATDQARRVVCVPTLEASGIIAYDHISRRVSLKGWDVESFVAEGTFLSCHYLVSVETPKSFCEELGESGVPSEFPSSTYPHLRLRPQLRVELQPPSQADRKSEGGSGYARHYA